MASWFELPITKDEAFVLRELLTQTASPGSFQSQFIIRLDAKLEEEDRPRRGRPCPCWSGNEYGCRDHGPLATI